MRFAWPEIAERLDFDSEPGMFCAVGGLNDRMRLKLVVESVTSNPEAIRGIIARAEISGFDLDD